MKRFLLRALYALLALVAVIAVSGWVYTQQPQFGPSGETIRSQAVLSSPNFVDGEFKSLIETPLFAEDVTFPEMVWRNMTEERPHGL